MGGRMGGSDSMLKPSETQFRGAVIELAEWCGWRAYGIRRSDGVLLSDTAVGFPDLVIAKAGRLLIPELKRDRDTRTPEQLAWADCLPVENYRLWRPTDMDAIQELLTTRV